MIDDFLPFCESITLVGGGDVSRSTLEEALIHAPNLVAADGGADRALALGHDPLRVVGDMDSVSEAARAHLGAERFQQIEEQDSTDFDKALRSVGASLVIGVGFLGRRLDHELACLNSLVRHADRPCVLLGEKDLCFHLPGELALELPVGMRLSLFPMAGLEARAEGLRWSFDALTMAPWDKIGTSNEVAGPVRLRADRPGLLVMLPRAALPRVVEALA
ncbi:thiamine diphosphokinase [Aliiroseovarius sp.]|uniref:thiamine diphosphokinase n=1 Tax=Aliiroseovarius sp. TaxID=1872442 RepID=UPI002626825E|nr:thiamine diphosphokinase [Aliiroseovarius sp.]